MKLIFLLPAIALLSLCCQSTPPKEPSISLNQFTKMMSVFFESTNQTALKVQEELKRYHEQMESEHKKVSARQDMEIKALKEAIDSSHKEYIESCKMSDALDKELKKQMEINKKLEQEWRALNQGFDKQDVKYKNLAEELEKSRKEIERLKDSQKKTK